MIRCAIEGRYFALLSAFRICAGARSNRATAALNNLDAIAPEVRRPMTDDPVSATGGRTTCAVTGEDASPGTGRGVYRFTRRCGGWGGTR